jgi:hypothetical protein
VRSTLRIPPPKLECHSASWNETILAAPRVSVNDA